jgi:homoserine O-acetyltransferase
LKIVTKKKQFTQPLYLESGRIIEPWEIIYETYGELNEDKSNAILITHALSGSHHAAGKYSEKDKKAGWWDDFIGEGKAVDTNKYFVISTNVIGSCFGSTSPMNFISPGSTTRYRFKFPVVTIKDMVKAQKILIDSLGITKLRAIIGGSMGGMQALRFAVEYPNFAKDIIPMATTYQTKPYVIAMNKIMIEAVKNDTHFKNGNYEPQDVKKHGLQGLSIGRMLGFLGYISPQTFDKKFGRDYLRNDGLFELFGRFQVESYLDYNGANFPSWFDPLSYIYILKAISLFDISRGYSSVEDAFSLVKDNMHLISFKGDTLFFPEEMREIKDIMDKLGKKCSYHEIDSNYGHDSFLVEVEKFEHIVKDILKD